jgi:hypothetical protein
MSIVRTSPMILLSLSVVLALGCRTKPSEMPSSGNELAVSNAPASSVASKWDYRIIDHSVLEPPRFGGTRVFVVGHRRFAAPADFLSWVASLPQGTSLHWDSGCAKYRLLPLEGSTLSMDEFKRFCIEHRIEFTWHYGY